MCTFLKGAGKTLLCFAPLFFIQHFVLLHLLCVEHQLTYTHSSSSSSASAMTTTTSPVPHRSLLELSRSVENITRVLRDESSPPARPSLRTRRRSSLKPLDNAVLYIDTGEEAVPASADLVHINTSDQFSRFEPLPHITGNNATVRVVFIVCVCVCGDGEPCLLDSVVFSFSCRFCCCGALLVSGWRVPGARSHGN